MDTQQSWVDGIVITNHKAANEENQFERKLLYVQEKIWTWLFFLGHSTPNAFFSVKLRKRALIRGRKPGVGGNGGEGRDKNGQ
jgi:hypothetical protein